jgi:hypothetical protein
MFLFGPLIVGMKAKQFELLRKLSQLYNLTPCSSTVYTDSCGKGYTLRSILLDMERDTPYMSTLHFHTDAHVSFKYTLPSPLPHVKKELQRYILSINLSSKTTISCDDILDPGPEAHAGLR